MPGPTIAMGLGNVPQQNKDFEAAAEPLLEPVDGDPFGGLERWANQPDEGPGYRRWSFLPGEEIREPGQGEDRSQWSMHWAWPGVAKSLIGDAVNALTAPTKVMQGQMTPEQGAQAATPGLVDLATAGLGQEAKAGTLQMMTGPRAEKVQGLGNSQYALEDAKDAHAAQWATPETIWARYGWFPAKDGNFKYEIPDTGSELDPSVFNPSGKLKLSTSPSQAKRLGDIFQHDKLFEAYPHLADMPVRGTRAGGGALGAYDPDPMRIELQNGLSQMDAHSTLLHEIQHAIQHYEGFAPGGSVEQFLPSNYRAREAESLGEIKQIIDNHWMGRSADKPSTGGVYLAAMHEADPTIFPQLRGSLDHEFVRALPEDAKRELLIHAQNYDDIRAMYQHAAQEYHSLGGEVESRNTEHRWLHDDYESFPEGHAAYPTMQQSFLPPWKIARSEAFRTWHGTPNEFDPEGENRFGSFRDDKMGTGEGAQTFGWGHYLAGAVKTAQTYRDKLSGSVTHITDNGMPVQKKELDRIAQKLISERTPAEDYMHYMSRLYNKSSNSFSTKRGYVDTLKRRMKEESENLNKLQNSDEYGDNFGLRLYYNTKLTHQMRIIEDLQNKLNFANTPEIDRYAMEEKFAGHLLHAEVHPDEHELIDYNMGHSEQKPGVLEKLQQMRDQFKYLKLPEEGKRVGNDMQHYLSTLESVLHDKASLHKQAMENHFPSTMDQQEAYDTVTGLTKDLGSNYMGYLSTAALSRLLDRVGIPGRMFYDQNSRNDLDKMPKILFKGRSLQSIIHTLISNPVDNSQELAELTQNPFLKAVLKDLSKNWQVQQQTMSSKTPSLDHYIEQLKKYYKKNGHNSLAKMLDDIVGDLSLSPDLRTRNYIIHHPRHITIRGRNGEMLDPVEHNPFTDLPKP